jgi:hypothetical protein
MTAVSPLRILLILLKICNHVHYFRWVYIKIYYLREPQVHPAWKAVPGKSVRKTGGGEHPRKWTAGLGSYLMYLKQQILNNIIAAVSLLRSAFISFKV